MTVYTKEQFWKLYEKLPQELKDTLWAEETGNATYGACEKQGVTAHLNGVVELVGAVLIGLLLPQDFQKELEQLGIQKKTAEKVAREIHRFVFYPVKPALEQLHRMEIEVTAKIVTPKPSEQPEEQKLEEGPSGEDRYREQLE